MASPVENREPSADAEEIRRIAEVLAHPLRMRLLIALDIESPLSPDTLSSRTGVPIHKVRRHLNALVDGGFVAVAREESHRNATRRYFTLTRRPLITLAEDVLLGDRERRQYTVGIIRVIFDEATLAASNSRLGERPERFIANCPGRVDERGWRELSELHHETLDRAQRIIEESRIRLGTGEDEAIGVISEQILLEAPRHAPGYTS